MMITIGTCSLCRGPVCYPETWAGTIPPTPMCRNCKATPANPHGPVIPMNPASRPEWDPVQLRKELDQLLGRRANRPGKANSQEQATP